MEQINIKDNIFREYDIRGIYNEDLTEDTAYFIGRGFGTYIKSIGQNITVIGHDNRVSSPTLSENLIKGIRESGIDVIDLGLVTTPMYYYSKILYNINSGIMVTASHNPSIYNGFKVSFEKEKNAFGKSIIMLRDIVKKGEYANGLGNLIHKDITDDYIKLLVNNVNLNKKLKVIVDCGNGTGSIIIKKILDKLNIEYKLMYCESDGTFPNHDPDPSLDKNMLELSKMVTDLNYDLGIGIDGDADRVGLVDNLGNIIKTDYYLIVMYKYLCNNLKNKKALFDVKCSRSLIEELKKIDITPVMYRTGNSYINAKMQDDDFDFGGEYSGHMYFRDKFLGFDDGIYAGLRMIELLSNKGTSLSEELRDIKRYYSTEELKINTDDIKKFELVNKVKSYCKEKGYEIIEIDGVRVEFNDSWALVRVSNTTPCLTLRFEAETKERLEKIKKEFIDYINSLL